MIDYARKEIELLALRAELEGMISDNRLRELQGSSPAWGGTEFEELAKKIRAIGFRLDIKRNEGGKK